MNKNNINIEIVLFFPLIYLGLFINSVSLIGGSITGLLALIYLFKIILEKPINNIIGITMLILLYLLMYNNYLILEPTLKIIILIFLLFIKNYKFWIKYFITNSILLFLLNIYYYYREYSKLEIINFTSTILITILVIYKCRNYLVKWNIKNLSFRNKYFKFIHYLLITFLYFNNAILIKKAQGAENYHISLITIILPILIFYILYIIINPIIKKEAIV